MNQLQEIADRIDCPKFRLHKYAPVYHALFQHLRKEPISILEVGVDEGLSIDVWAEFFPKARIHGLDIFLKNEAVAKAQKNDRVTLQKVDQSNIHSLNTVAGAYDIIIDDGSHVWEDQMITYTTLRRLLRGAGHYVVEDVQPENIYKFQQLGTGLVFDLRDESWIPDDIMWVTK